jgi:Flp pilus assembly pilin Flp
MLKVLLDRRAVTSIEYAMVAGALAFVLFEVMQAPAHALGAVLENLFGGAGGHPVGG